MNILERSWSFLIVVLAISLDVWFWHTLWYNNLWVIGPWCNSVLKLMSFIYCSTNFSLRHHKDKIQLAVSMVACYGNDDTVEGSIAFASDVPGQWAFVLIAMRAVAGLCLLSCLPFQLLPCAWLSLKDVPPIITAVFF